MNILVCSNAWEFSDKIPSRRSNARPKSRRLLRFEGLERRDLLSGVAPAEATGSAQVAPATAAAPSSTVSVKGFGAKGDGVTNDQPAIQAAIESLAATGGTVYVPAGDYRLGDSIVIDHDNITLTGQGASSVLRLMDGVQQTGIILPHNYSGSVNLDPALLVHPVTISHLTIDGNHNPVINYGDGPDYFGIMVRQAQDVTLSGLIVRDWASDGISVGNGGDPVDHLTVENCLITGIHRNGIHIDR